MSEAMKGSKVSAADLNWGKVDEAARVLRAHAQSARYAAPEFMQFWVNEVAVQMNVIAEALCLTRLDGGGRRE